MQRIFEPITIKTVEIPNRICRTGHGTFLSQQGQVSDDLVAYHRERAADGVGLIFLDLASVHPSSEMGNLRNWDDSIIDGYRRVVEALHPLGTKVFHQLIHGGAMSPSAVGAPPWSCSPITMPEVGIPAVEMSIDQIDEVVAAYGQAAARAEQGGLDGIEVHAAHSYLPASFLSPLTNRRRDDYNGSLVERMRFLREVLQSIRAAVGDDFVVGIRISDDFVPGGLTPQDCAEVVRALETGGLIDFVNGSQGGHFDPPTMYPPMGTPVGVMLPSSGPIVAAAKRIPRIVGGRFHTLEDAEQVLEDGIADLVGMVRPYLADPQILRKARSGRSGEIRPCLSCNEGCIGGVYGPAHRIGCVVNPAAGFEEFLSEDLIARTSSPRRVVVVGGGPAGMEAARIAALGGHDVSLYEARDRLGGQELLARRIPRMAAVGRFADWHERELRRLGVQVHVATRATADLVAAAHPDVVILATGGVETDHRMLVASPGERIEVDPAAALCSVEQTMTDDGELTGESYVVFDDATGYEPVAVSEHLLHRGAAVTFVTRREILAAALGPIGRSETVLRDLYATGRFTMITLASVVAIGPDGCTVRRAGDIEDTTVRATRAIVVAPRAPVLDLADELRSRVADVRVVGDALSARNLQAAVHEGHHAARSIGAVPVAAQDQTSGSL